MGTKRHLFGAWPRELQGHDGTFVTPGGARPDASRTVAGLTADAQPGERLGGSFRLMMYSSAVTLLAILLLPVALGLPAKFDPWAVSSIASGTVNVTFVDAQGHLLAHRGYRQEETVPLDDMPPYLVQAVLAMEDKRFYRHWGVDILGVLRAARANMAAGRIVEGGSTITQQLARNLYLDPSKDFGRKAQEAALAFWLEQKLGKDEILELYLNRIYLGAGAYGVEAASQVYFSKSVRDLTLAEAALIAGLPKAPAQLSPVKDLERAQARAAQVLDRLEATGAVPVAEIDAARAVPIGLTLQQRSRDMRAAYFVDWVYSRLPLWIDGPPRELVVETTIDLEMQNMAQEALLATLDDLPRGITIDQGALVALDHSGAVKAMVGGRDYLESQFNRATQAVRQPGSAFKPLVYMAALQDGYSRYSSVVDRPVSVDGWTPANANRRHSGRMYLQTALTYSVNTVAVQLAQDVGLDKVADYARASGISTPLPAHPSLALGAMGTKLVDLTGAYVPFANGGFEAQPHGITRIRTVDGDILYEHARRAEGVLPPPYLETAQGRPVTLTGAAAQTVPIHTKLISGQDAKAMTGMLRQVIRIGTGKRASLGAREAAGKTGTTNNNRDALFLGYTADLVAGVWLGNDDYGPMGRVYGGTLPARTWQRFMLAAHEGLPLRRIHKRYRVAPHASQIAEAADDEEEDVEMADRPPAGNAALRTYLTGLADALTAAPALDPDTRNMARARKAPRMDRSVYRSRNN